MTPTTLTRKISKAYEPFGPLEGINLQRAVALLGNPAGKTLFFESLISPVLGRAEKAEDWYVASSHGSSDGSSVQVFVWPPGTGTRVHDHSSWGAFRCVSGSVLEVRYARRDDGSKIEHARLRESWRRLWGRKDGASTVLPYAGGIHRLYNPGDETAISVHLYGPQKGEIDGRDYDPFRDYVCDRLAA